MNYNFQSVYICCFNFNTNYRLSAFGQHHKRRPDWEVLFKKIAERTPTNGKVGVFFCGPKGMSKSIRNTIMKVQVLTNLRGSYLGTSKTKSLARELGKIENCDLQLLRSRGSNIRFVFREENFG